VQYCAPFDLRISKPTKRPEIRLYIRLYKAMMICALLLSIEAALLLNIPQIVQEVEIYGSARCYELVKDKEVIYLNGKCYLPQSDKNLGFLVDLNEVRW
jgi:hypothetical protein